MRYLVDTSVLVDLSKGIGSTEADLIALIVAGGELCVCAVVLSEFIAGLTEDELLLWREFLDSLRFLPASPEIGTAAGRDRYAFARRGITIATADALIAATARAWNATVLTENVKDFPMPDVRTLSLRT